jgi:hypothetical protein
VARTSANIKGEKDIFLSCLNHKICRYWGICLTNDGLYLYCSRTYMFVDLKGSADTLRYSMFHSLIQKRIYVWKTVYICLSARLSCLFLMKKETRHWDEIWVVYKMSFIRIVCWIMAACRLAGSYSLSDEHAASNLIKNNIQTVCFFIPLINTYQTRRYHVGCCVSVKHVLSVFTVWNGESIFLHNVINILLNYRGEWHINLQNKF